LQIELVRFQRHVISQNLKILVIFEGREAAGKDGVIKRITEHLSPRETRVVALGKPSDRDRRLMVFPALRAADASRAGNRADESQLVQPRRCGARDGVLH
jgi:hypothetical protein